MRRNTYDIEKLVGRSFRIFNTSYPENTVGIMMLRGNNAEVYDEYTIPALRRKESRIMQQLAEKAMTM